MFLFLFRCSGWARGQPLKDGCSHEVNHTYVCFIWIRANKLPTLDSDKISTSLVECEHVKAKIGKALRADGSPRMWKKLPPARGQKGFLS